MANSGRGMLKVTGVSDLLQDIENAGGNIDKAVAECVKNSLEQVGMKMQLFMLEHRETGDTLRSYEDPTIGVDKKGNVNGVIGYNVQKGGLPAIFLDIGTPTQPGHFFRYYAITNSSEEIKKIQRETLKQILGGLIK